MGRRCTRNQPLSIKLSEDVYCLLLCLKKNTQVPHTILINGKLCRSYLEASRARSESQVSSSMSSQPAAQLTPMKEVNSLKDTVKSLKQDVSTLFNILSSRIPSTCHIHSRVSEPCSEQDLSSLIGCPVINAVQVNAGLSWKAKIHTQCLYDALQSSSDTQSVRIWRNNHPKASPTASSSSPPTSYCLFP